MRLQSSSLREDFSLYGDYLAKRLEELNFGLLSNEAILIQDRKTAEKNNDLYNKADSASVELAAKVPRNVRSASR